MAPSTMIDLTVLLSATADPRRIEQELTDIIDAPAMRLIADKPGLRLFGLSANRTSYDAYFGPTAHRDLPPYLRQHIVAIEEAPTRRLA